MLSYKKPIKSCLKAYFILSLPLVSLAAPVKTEIPMPMMNTIPKNQELGQDLYDRYPWAGLYYYGITTSDTLGQILVGEIHRWPEHIQSVEITHTLSKENFLRRLVYPLVGVGSVSQFHRAQW